MIAGSRKKCQSCSAGLSRETFVGAARSEPLEGRRPARKFCGRLSIHGGACAGGFRLLEVLVEGGVVGLSKLTNLEEIK